MLEVRDFPLVVANDIYGGDIFKLNIINLGGLTDMREAFQSVVLTVRVRILFCPAKPSSKKSDRFP